MIPLPRLLLETDSPFFAPRASTAVLHIMMMMDISRAKYSSTNCIMIMTATLCLSIKIEFAQPSHLFQVAAAVAKLKGVTIKQVQA